MIKYISFSEYLKKWKHFQDSIRYTSVKHEFSTLPLELTVYESSEIVTYRPKKPSKLELILK